MSAISSRLTTPSPSRSNVWKPSRSSRTCEACNFERALLSFKVSFLDGTLLEPSMPPNLTASAPRVGDDGTSLVGVSPLGVHDSELTTGVENLLSLEGVRGGMSSLVGTAEELMRRGDGEAGDAARLKGELRAEAL